MTTVPCWARVRGPLAPYAEGFRVELERLGYTPLTAATHVRLLAHLSRWLAREGVDGSGLTPAVVDAYFAERRAAGYVGHVTGRALQPLLGYLQRLGVVSVPAPEVPASPEGRLLASYRDYLITERGLAAATVELNVRMVRPFLLDRLRVRNGRLDLEQLTAGEVTAFVVSQSRQRSKSVQRMLTGLRSLLGFCTWWASSTGHWPRRCPRWPDGLKVVFLKRWTVNRWPRCWPAAMSGPRPVAGTWRSSPCWCGWGCAPVRWPH